MSKPSAEERFQAYLDAVASGVTKKQASELSGVPYASFRMWLCEPERYGIQGDAGARYNAARNAAADAWADKATDAVAKATDKDSAAVARVQEDHYRWRARVANPKVYGERQQQEVTVSIAQLHIDALKASASARLASPAPEPKRLTDGEDGTPIIEAEPVDG